MSNLPSSLAEYTKHTAGHATYDNALATITGKVVPVALWGKHYLDGMTAGACAVLLSAETVTIPRELFDRMEATIYDALVLWGDQSDVIYKPGHLAKKRKEARQLAEEVSVHATQKGTP